MSNTVPGTARPAAPQNTTGSPDYNYPTSADEKVRKMADFIGAHGIIDLLDRLRIFAFGDLKKTLGLADHFARQKSLLEAADSIQSAQLSLSAAWQGDAYAQFDKYAGFATSNLTKSQDSVIKLTATMTSIAQAVLDTYKTLISFIGNCAATLSTVAGKIGIAVATAAIPILDIFTSKEVLDTINSAFGTFWRDCTAAMTAMLTNMGNMVSAGIVFTSIESNFPKLPAVGSSAEVIGDPQRWRIKPGADHG